MVGKTYNGQPYIIAVNDSPSSVRATINISGSYVSVNVLFENRYVSVASGRYKIPLPVSSGNVYSVLTQAQAAPSITTQPVSQAICSGNTATFTVAATGPGLAYQWYNSAGSISGATSASYTTGVAGGYYCVVSGTYSPAATSNTATLTVNTAPPITRSRHPRQCVRAAVQRLRWRRQARDLPISGAIAVAPSAEPHQQVIRQVSRAATTVWSRAPAAPLHPIPRY